MSSIISILVFVVAGSSRLWLPPFCSFHWLIDLPPGASSNLTGSPLGRTYPTSICLELLKFRLVKTRLLSCKQHLQQRTGLTCSEHPVARVLAAVLSGSTVQQFLSQLIRHHHHLVHPLAPAAVGFLLVRVTHCSAQRHTVPAEQPVGWQPAAASPPMQGREGSPHCVSASSVAGKRWPSSHR